MYTQHVPLLINTLDAAMKGKLRESNFPAIGSMTSATQPSIVVFVVGGVTYEESTKVAELNGGGGGKVVLGSTQIHNRFVFVLFNLECKHTIGPFSDFPIYDSLPFVRSSNTFLAELSLM